MNRSKSKNDKSRTSQSLNDFNTDSRLSLAFESLADTTSIDKITNGMTLPSNSTGPAKPLQKENPEASSKLRTDFQRSRLLNNAGADIEKNKQKDELEILEKKKRPSCWTTTTWILTFWTPPALLKACG